MTGFEFAAVLVLGVFVGFAAVWTLGAVTIERDEPMTEDEQRAQRLEDVQATLLDLREDWFTRDSYMSLIVTRPGTEAIFLLTQETSIDALIGVLNDAKALQVPK